MKTTLKTLLILTLTLVMSAPLFGNNDTVREITIKGTDNMKFDVTMIDPKHGETIRLTLKTISNMPANAMAHNVAIVDLGVNVEEFVLASMSSPDTEYISPDYKDQVIAYTEMIGGGEVSTIEFRVPDTPGDYEFVCTFPGHYFGGMKGVLRVTAAS